MARKKEIIGHKSLPKTFNGVKYYFFRSYGKRSEAEKQAKKFRKEGHRARIFPQLAQSIWTKRVHTDYELYVL